VIAIRRDDPRVAGVVLRRRTGVRRLPTLAPNRFMTLALDSDR